MQFKGITKAVLGIAALGLGAFAYAGTVEVENNISVSAKSGGNSAEAGEVMEGKSSADVEIKTTVNGVEVQSVEKHFEDLKEGIEEHFMNEDEDSHVETHVRVGSSTGNVEKEESIAPEENGAMEGGNSHDRAERIHSSFFTFFAKFFTYVRSIFIR